MSSNAGTISGSKEEAQNSARFETQFAEAIESNGVSTVDVVGIEASREIQSVSLCRIIRQLMGTVMFTEPR